MSGDHNKSSPGGASKVTPQKAHDKVVALPAITSPAAMASPRNSLLTDKHSTNGNHNHNSANNSQTNGNGSHGNSNGSSSTAAAVTHGPPPTLLPISKQSQPGSKTSDNGHHTVDSPFSPLDNDENIDNERDLASELAAREEIEKQKVKEKKIQEQQDVMKYVSFLDPDTIRWMNRRRPRNATAIPGHVMPTLALQLKEMFNSLDFDNSGGIDISELKTAVHFVTDKLKSGTGEHTVQDTKVIADFFVSMDKDNSGTVDFVEFLAAVTSTEKGSDALDVSDKAARLKVAFLEFANQLRRKRIDTNLLSDNVSAAEKYEELKSLYSINYFIDDGIEGQENDYEAYEKQKKEFGGGVLQSRHKKELSRAREAAHLLKTQREQNIATLNHGSHHHRPNSAGHHDGNGNLPYLVHIHHHHTTTGADAGGINHIPLPGIKHLPHHHDHSAAAAVSSHPNSYHPHSLAPLHGGGMAPPVAGAGGSGDNRGRRYTFHN